MNECDICGETIVRGGRVCIRGEWVNVCADCDTRDRPVPGGPPMREGNNPRTGIAYNE